MYAIKAINKKNTKNKKILKKIYNILINIVVYDIQFLNNH